MLNKETTQNLKGFAILVVMLGHLVNANKSSLPPEFSYFAAFSVSIFLILSGYGLSVSNASFGLSGFIRKRFSGVIIPYALATIIVSIVSGVIFTDPFRVLRVITLTNPLNPIDHTMWFIYFICLWYCLFYIINLFVKFRMLRIFLTIATSAYIYFKHPFMEIPRLNYQFTLHAFSFAIGVIMGEHKEKIPLRVLLFTSSVIFPISLYNLIDEYSMLSYMLSCLSFGILLISAFSCLQIKTLTLSFIGGISFEMYLLESFMLGFIYSDNYVINAMMFIILTTTAAYFFKKSISLSKFHYMRFRKIGILS